MFYCSTKAHQVLVCEPGNEQLQWFRWKEMAREEEEESKSFETPEDPFAFVVLR